MSENSTKNALCIFENNDFGSVRVHVDEHGEPWFVAKDVAQALGYTESTLSNTKRAFGHVPEEWKGRYSIPTPGGNQEMAILSEQGLYFFTARSDKPKALPFQKWLAGEVLPSIRKTGQYGVQLSYPDALRALAAEIELREAVEAQRALAEAQRDAAIRTKAEIGSRREAIAMATASAATRKVGSLENKLGIGRTYRQVKAITWLGEVFEISRAMYQQVGKKLTALSQRLGYTIQQISCPEYPEGVKAYHVEVIDMFRQELSRDLNMLGKYRLRVA